MTLPRKVYKAIESVVGPENISEDQAVLVGYAFHCGGGAIHPSSARWLDVSPEAVVLPGTTEEVQAVVKICRSHKVKFKAFSTGWGFWAAPGTQGVVQMDLRRMNRIIEIDEKNMYAVVEPYVTASQLQAEAMKKGLDINIAGCGPNHSVLAACTSMMGCGDKGVYTSHDNRNLLGVEWVLPTGEILRLGALGSGAGWFCGDGPGPSLRGIMRGQSGAMGGLGVFTKCATKLYPWPGPQKLEIKGENPQYGIETPKNFKFYMLVFPNWDKLADAVYEISEAQIAYILRRMCSPFLISACLVAGTNNEAYDRWPTSQRISRLHLEIVLAANSERELEYREKVLKDITAETGGEFLPLGEVFGELEPIALLALITGCYASRAYRLRDWLTSFGNTVSWDTSIKIAKIGEEVRKKYVGTGRFLEDAPESFYGGPYEQNKFSHFQGVIFYEPTDPHSRKAAFEYAENALQAVVANRVGVPIVAGPGTDERVGDYHLWLKKIKKILDPENLSDSTYYVATEKTWKKRVKMVLSRVPLSERVYKALKSTGRRIYRKAKR